MSSLPLADSVPAGEDKDKIAAQARQKFLGALANNTKWNELISHMRSLDGWRPSYRSKWVNGFVSGWDIEWFYHLPLPFVGVEWLDIGLHEHVYRGRLLHPAIVDHSPEILTKLKEIGFEFEARGDVVRIWGYHPKSYEDFLFDSES
ncbi:DUF6678 family protein [Chitinibacter sp. GC72]|uniref:DUF6678 family protein n=1 Tax=Chitinibacter sp. GC72 TaxID=1526917 RepID=UPI0012F91316|nr:DUF6678 family protein [Chitinibacter sp. GC72]